MAAYQMRIFGQNCDVKSGLSIAPRALPLRLSRPGWGQFPPGRSARQR